MSPEVPRLRARTVAVDLAGELLRLVPQGVSPDELSVWLREGEGMVGWGVAAQVRTRGTDRLGRAGAWWDAVRAEAQARGGVEDAVRLPGTGLVAFGSFTFSAGSGEESVLTVPQVLVGRRGGTTWLTQVTPADEAWPDAPAHLYRRDGGEGAPPRTSDGDERVDQGAVVERGGSVPAGRWPEVVAAAVARIRGGGLDKVVLARDVRVEAQGGASLRLAPVLERLEHRYPATWTFAVAGLVGATPEMLVRLQQGQVRSRVLAGTIPRGEGQAPELVRSEKDLAEHAFAVDSVREALAPHCSELVVPDLPYALELPDVYHLASDLTGTAAPGSGSLQLAEALHPSAAVCGTPTPAAARVIEEVEGMDRGRYAGPVGWMDGSGDGEWGIALRCGQLAADRRSMRLFAGGGIVAASDPEAELAETEVKLTAMRHALGLR